MWNCIFSFIHILHKNFNRIKMNKITNYLGEILFGAGGLSAVSYFVTLNNIEQIGRIILIIVSIISFSLAALVHKKKLKKIEDELKKNC